MADVVVIPCGPDPLDLMAARDASELAAGARQQRGGSEPVAMLVPMRVSRSKLADELPTALADLGKVLPAIGSRAAFPRARLNGLAVVESEPNSKAAEERRAVVRAIERGLG